MINRTLTKIVKETIKQYPVVLLTGPRQVGKSTLLRYILNSSFKYFTLEDIRSQSYIFNNPGQFLSDNPAPLIIDEVQLAIELFSEINAVVNKVKMSKGNDYANSMYILSGSNKGELLSKSKVSLAGRMAYLNMLPLSLNEIYNRDSVVFSFNQDVLKQRSKSLILPEAKLFNHIFKGFLPGINDSLNRDISIFYSSYVESYIEKDLKQIIDIKQKSTFVKFISLLASNIGQELIYSNYSKDLGVSLPTVKSWIDALEKSGIVYLLQPYYENSIKKRVVKRPKLYFFDTGLAAYLMGFDSSATLSNSIFKGRFFENFAFNELLKSFVNNGKNPKLYYFRDNNSNEIDIVYVKDAKLNLIEIKCGDSFNCGDCGNFNLLAGTKFEFGKRAIICSGNNYNVLKDGTIIIPVCAL